MAKYSGYIGLQAEEQETATGIWSAEIHELKVKGDIRSLGRSYQNGDKINADTLVSDIVSIVCSSALEKRIGEIRYVTLYGTRWTVDSISVHRPRVELSLGGVWTGDIPKQTPEVT